MTPPPSSSSDSGVDLGPLELPTLMILPEDGGYRLVYHARAFTTRGRHRVLHRRPQRRHRPAPRRRPASVSHRHRHRRAQRHEEDERDVGQAARSPADDALRPPTLRHLRHEGQPAAHARLPERAHHARRRPTAPPTPTTPGRDPAIGRRARLRRLHLRLLLQALRTTRTGQQQPPHPEPRASGAAAAVLVASRRCRRTSSI